MVINMCYYWNLQTIRNGRFVRPKISESAAINV